MIYTKKFQTINLYRDNLNNVIKCLYTHKSIYKFLSVHPCTINNGGCDHECNRDGDEAKCSCKTNFLLGADGVSCTESKPMKIS